MRLTSYFLPITKEVPAEAEIISHKLMLRAGLVRQGASGIYSWLPLGLKILKKIETIVRQEQDAIGCHEMLMPTIQSADLWQESGRYDDYGKEMLRIKDRKGRAMLYGPTNEELITDIFRREVRSYKNLPQTLYHIQWKFRDEVRPRFGVMRGREFLMKDAYSFDLNKAEAVKAYNAQFISYLRIFSRLGLRAIPMKADTGPIGGELSHEFIVLAERGESEVYYEAAFDRLDPMAVTPEAGKDYQATVDVWTAPYAATDEMHDADKCPVDQNDLITGRGIEVGHIFYFGTKYSEPMKAEVQNADGTLVPVHMGSYGVGVSRLVGAIIEASHDENGIIWPQSVAPFDVGLINLRVGDQACDGVCDRLYQEFAAVGLDVLYDDSHERAGGKFATMDLIGLPYQVAIGPRGVKTNEAEIKIRSSGEKFSVSIDHLTAWLKDRYSI